ncbi:MAG: NAD-dependent epimerase/dehydratase family protein [Pseudomonadota bacterium]
MDPSAYTGKILVTGAGGFVGTALCHALARAGIAHVPALRRASAPGQVAIGELSGATDWNAALAGCDTVIHLAARAHVMHDSAADPLASYRVVNVDATLALARQALRLGVRRFVYVSSVKVNGEATQGAPFTPFDTPAPQDAYGQTKHEAETALRALCQDGAMALVIVRPPLVYGPGVRANFRALMRLVAAGLPLPLASVENRRSLVALANLVDLLIVCARHPRAGGHVFLVSDGDDMSTPELIRRMAVALGRRARLLPLPPALLRMAARLLGKAGAADRLLGSLQVDISHTRSVLGWHPPVDADSALRECASFYLNHREDA